MDPLRFSSRSDRFREGCGTRAHTITFSRNSPESHQYRYRRLYHGAADLRRLGSRSTPVSLDFLTVRSGVGLVCGCVLRNLIRFRGTVDMLDRARGSAEPVISRWAYSYFAVATCILLSACGGSGAPLATPADLEKVRAAA